MQEKCQFNNLDKALAVLKCDGTFCREKPFAAKAAAEPLHPCPFLADVHTDAKRLCNCCSECEQECGANI